MRRAILGRILGVLLLLLAVSSACNGDPAEEAVEQSFRSLIGAIEAHDADIVWSLTTKPFREFCDQLQRELADAGRLVRLYFPEWEHDRLLESLAWHRLGEATDGRSLFARLLDFEQVRSGGAVRAGLEHDSVLIQGNRATIMTKAREKFTFVQEEDGVWRTDIYERARGFPLVETLRENMATLRSNVEHLRGLYETGTDPKTPEGAFNQFRQALASADGGVLERLLDKPAREAVEALQRELVEVEKARAAERSERLAAVDLDKLDLAEATRSPRGLLRQLARHSVLSLLLGVTRDSTVHLVRVDSRGEASVITTEAEEFPMLRESDGLWHLTEVADLIREGILVPLQSD